MNWFRMYTEITRDHKLRRLPPSQRWLWVAVLCLARQSPLPGYLLLAPNVPITLEDLADEANIPINEVESGFAAFEAKDMIHREGDTYVVAHWNVRQFESDDTTERVKKWRSKRNVGADDTSNVDVTLQERCSNDDVTPPDTDTDTEYTCSANAETVSDEAFFEAVTAEYIAEKQGPKNGKGKQDEYSADFERFWEMYPNKHGKKPAYAKWKARLREGIPIPDLMRARDNYAKVKAGVDMQFVMLGETFLGPKERYKDFLTERLSNRAPPVERIYQYSKSDLERMDGIQRESERQQRELESGQRVTAK